MDDNIASILSAMLYFKFYSAAFLTAIIVVIVKVVHCNAPLVVKSKNGRKVIRKRFILVIFVLTLCLISAPHAKRVFQDREKADQFVAYCEEYKQEYGQYPEKMEDMVPEFFDKNQLAKFGYDASGPSHFLHYKAYGAGKRLLWYMTGVPFHTNNYRFDEKKWLHYGI